MATKVSKNISTDLQEAEADGKETKSRKEVHWKQNFMHTFLNFPATVAHNPFSAQVFNLGKCQALRR